MTLTAIVLILISAFLHVGWNLLSKNEHPTAAFFLAANFLGCLFLTPIFFLYGQGLNQFPTIVWVFIGLAGLCQALYLIWLAGAYRLGDLSIAYPLIRSAPIVIVTVVVLLLGCGDQMSWQSILGIGLVVGGNIVLPMKYLADFRLKNYLNLSCLLGLLAACGTAGYSIVDDAALQHLRNLPMLSIGSTQVAFLYALMEGLSTSLWLALFVLPRYQGRAALVNIVRTRMRPLVLTGIGMYMTYPLVLVSMAFVNNVSYVVAFRQVSIPLGVALGVLVFGEARYPLKFWCTAIIFIGLVLIGTG